MGYFGGAAVNQALKANRDLLKKRSKRKRTQTTVSNKVWVDHKHATPEQLAEIRTKIRKQHKIRIIKTIIVTLMIILGTIVIIHLST
ncbi:hypothetical protein [uncultured Dokdonia sp.]|uniref:hypothetical protein n=1 Tax=uncultured Dokdonia sp. TaxID=575653 RepID=UPI00261010A2|nr:hypothetical protein [uncultured Dokdonia sp.]